MGITSLLSLLTNGSHNTKYATIRAIINTMKAAILVSIVDSYSSLTASKNISTKSTSNKYLIILLYDSLIKINNVRNCSLKKSSLNKLRY